MRITSIICCCAVAMATGALALGGEVWANDGRVLTGTVRIDNDGSIAVGGVSSTRLRIDEILYAWLGTAKPAAAVAGMDAPVVALTPQSVGGVRPGQLSYQNTGIYTFRGSGKAINSNTDSFCLFSRGVSGDAQLVARIREVGPAIGVVALMVRSDLDPSSRFAMIGVNPQGDFSFRYRAEPGQRIVEQTTVAKAKFPLWVKLVRRGRNCLWYRSQSGISWQLVGQLVTDKQYADWKNGGSKPPEPGIGLGERISAGVAIASGSTNEVRGTLDKLQIQELEPDRTRSAPAAATPEVATGFVPVLFPDTTKGVYLTDGTFLPRATLASADEKSATIADGTGKDTAIPVGRMARVNLAPITGQMAAGMPGDIAGVLLASAGFMEGQIKSVRDGEVRVSSIVFGLSSFRLADDVRALSWHPATERGSSAVVTLNDGSSFGASSLKIEQGDLVVAGPTLGARRAPARDVNVVRCSADRAMPLARLVPDKINGAVGESVVAGSALDPVWGNLFTCSGRGAWLGVATPAGAEVTYNIPPGYRRLTCWVAVPDQGGAGGTINFTVDVDGKTVTKSRPVKVEPGRPMAFLSVPVDGRTLTLCAEPETRDADPGYVIWGDALLSK